ncbi:pyroglutamyl-peptidase I [Ideonella sp. BN130291]|uniref:pyroglutamyl-peptidase I n=1 Tax=Ideonella sp. BN130291 TaxID=3112940 RepID=UPI002E25DD4C|nr:pyroglutamyl-peptidase I [Ideonella sp. BN130291]
MHQRVLITGFEPFGGEAVNPSAQVLAQLAPWRPAGDASLVVQLLPCVFGQAIAVLEQALRREQPQLVIALGQAASRDEVTVERVAINIDDARIPDNAGAQPIDLPVVPGGPAAYFSSLPIKAIVVALQQAGIPASVSQTAGTFVCNHVFYGLAHALATRHTGVRGGFIHLPCLPQQTAALGPRPGMPLVTMVQAVQIAVQVSLRTSVDLRTGGGTID